jgi:hypothetical protein
MTRFIYIFFFFGSLMHSMWSNSQIIQAGNYDCDDFLIDLESDDTLYSSLNMGHGFDSLFVDLNNDDIPDVKFEYNSWDGDQWGSSFDWKIIPLNANQVAFKNVEICTSNLDSIVVFERSMIKTFSKNETIDLNQNWVNSELFINYSASHAEQPNVGGYACSMFSTLESSSYIGIKLIDDEVISYGWLQLKFISHSDKLQQKLLVEKGASAKETEFPKQSILVYPNPAKNTISIQPKACNSEINKVLIMNLAGENVLSHQANEGISEMFIGNLASGLYFMYLFSDISNEINEANMIKFVVE